MHERRHHTPSRLLKLVGMAPKLLYVLERLAAHFEPKFPGPTLRLWASRLHVRLRAHAHGLRSGACGDLSCAQFSWVTREFDMSLISFEFEPLEWCHVHGRTNGHMCVHTIMHYGAAHAISRIERCKSV